VDVADVDVDAAAEVDVAVDVDVDDDAYNYYDDEKDGGQHTPDGSELALFELACMCNPPYNLTMMADPFTVSSSSSSSISSSSPILVEPQIKVVRGRGRPKKNVL
jgi:hypothetical protein